MPAPECPRSTPSLFALQPPRHRRHRGPGGPPAQCARCDLDAWVVAHSLDLPAGAGAADEASVAVHGDVDRGANRRPLAAVTREQRGPSALEAIKGLHVTPTTSRHPQL